MKVYLIEDPANGLVKIGVSDTPHRRFGYLQSAQQERLYLRHEHDAGSRAEAFRIERAAHAALASRRVKGEWFAISLDDAMAALKAPVPTKNKTSSKRSKKLVVFRFHERAFS